MPLLFSVGQHHTLEVNRSLRDDEKVMAFLDDIFYCSESNRVGGKRPTLADPVLATLI